ncbi:hypothetical protein CsSME_00044261 [Camellia sinensis var. sinensis]
MEWKVYQPWQFVDNSIVHVCPGVVHVESEDARIVREFAQLLDAAEACHNTVMPSISERFMGMRSAIITNNSSLKPFGGKLGFTMLQLSDIIDKSLPIAESPLDVVASELLKLLGFQEGKILETSPFDLVFIHIGDGEKNEERAAEISARLHMSLVMSYGLVSENNDPNLSVICKDEKHSNLSSLFPRQSYVVKGMNLRKNVRHHCPMLIAQWQNAVTRKDMAETFSFKDFKEHGGVLTIPADRFIHEVAFKLWKAPKYGA